MSEPRTCGKCRLPIHQSDTGLRYFGHYVAHEEGTCIRLLHAEIERLHKDRWSITLWRSLERLHLAIKECARIGFQQSSPTTNSAHAEVWLALNDAQKDAALKLKTYSTGNVEELEKAGGAA